MSNVKKICICAFCMALCCVLPPAFHAVGLGAVFSPMHLPVLLCGLLCGWPYGAFCGVAGPLLSCLTTGMPSAARLLYMAPELCRPVPDLSPRHGAGPCGRRRGPRHVRPL